MNLAALAMRLEEATTIRQTEAFLSHYLKSFGFYHYAFTYYSGHVKTGRKLQYDFVSEALRPWHLHYLQESYADVDRTLEDSHIFTLPLYWDVHQQLAEAKHTREKRIRLESIEYGIDKGLSVPVHGPNGDFATLALHQCQGESGLKNYLAGQFEWLSAAHIFYHYLQRLLNLNKKTMLLSSTDKLQSVGESVLPNISYHLTRREEQCLELTAKSWRVEQIAKELSISVRTVNFHIQNANKKLGVNNKYQAAYKYTSHT